MHFHIITLGKLKEPYWREAEAEYLKRLRPFIKLHIHELKEESFSEKDPPELIKKKEAEKITKELNKIKGGHTVALDEHGKSYSSVGFAKHVQQFPAQGGSAFGGNNLTTFIVGGPLGLHPSILALANETISLSTFTFTHQMARVILLEQIYRAMMIQQNRPYHY